MIVFQLFANFKYCIAGVTSFTGPRFSKGTSRKLLKNQYSQHLGLSMLYLLWFSEPGNFIRSLDSLGGHLNSSF